MTQPSSDPRVADLVKAGQVRVALYVPQYSRDPKTGELRGWTIDLVEALGTRLGIKGVPVQHPTPPDAVKSVVSGACDTSILGIEKVRAAEVDYTPGLLEADYSILVPAGSSIGSVADADKPNATFEIMRSGNAAIMASLSEIMLRYAPQLPGSRVIEQRYGFNTLALAVRKGQADRLACLTEFVEEAKASGLVQRA